VTQARFSPDGRNLATSSEDHSARLWSIVSGQPQFEMKHGGPINSIEFSPEGSLLVTASADGAAQLWDANTGRAVGGPLRHEAEVLWAAFDPAGSRVATASRDKSVRIWSVQTGQAIAPPLIHADSLHTHNSVTFSADGARLATICRERSSNLGSFHRPGGDAFAQTSAACSSRPLQSRWEETAYGIRRRHRALMGY
jgi:WD40 repeat protein